MFFAAPGNFAKFLPLAAGANNISNAAVVFTGLSLVFLILMLLIVIMTIQGKIFSSMDAKKTQESQSPPKDAKQKQQLATAKAPPPFVQAGIAPEVVAAIVAAISADTGSTPTLRSVTKAKNRRGNWGFAGAMQNTKPF